MSKLTPSWLPAALVVACIATTAPVALHAQSGSKAAQTKLAASAVCCVVTAIDGGAGTISVRVNATGAILKVAVKDRASLKNFAVGNTLAFQVDPGSTTGCSSNAATSSGGGSSCGSNVGRNADTRPKDCVATNSAGQQTRVACPPNVPIKEAK